MPERVPETCGSLQAVRAEIDLIDRKILELLASRLRYVHRAADFKRSATDVAAPAKGAERAWRQENMGERSWLKE